MPGSHRAGTLAGNGIMTPGLASGRERWIRRRRSIGPVERIHASCVDLMKNQYISWRRSIVCLIVIQALCSSRAAGFGGIGSGHVQLKNSFIVEIGVVRSAPPPVNTNWVDEVYSLNCRCFTMLGYFGFDGFGENPAMLVVDENKLIRLAVFEQFIGTINVKINFVRMKKCPAHANIIPCYDGLNPEECLKILDEYRKKLDRYLDGFDK